MFPISSDFFYIKKFCGWKFINHLFNNNKNHYKCGPRAVPKWNIYKKWKTWSILEISSCHSHLLNKWMYTFCLWNIYQQTARSRSHCHTYVRADEYVYHPWQSHLAVHFSNIFTIAHHILRVSIACEWAPLNISMSPLRIRKINKLKKIKQGKNHRTIAANH